MLPHLPNYKYLKLSHIFYLYKCKCIFLLFEYKKRFYVYIVNKAILTTDSTDLKRASIGVNTYNIRFKM